ncbi:acyl carrier protein [Mycobacterium marinum]|uniref:acyl carrier protein n=1 Tax=Mycobacterium marinum TaxID=1781 RepID=UPI000E28AB69|nr:acyl carrier protein [Mycobacterium marinum]
MWRRRGGGRSLASLYAQILGGSDRVSAADSFFDLGGDSLSAMRLIAAANTTSTPVCALLMCSKPPPSPGSRAGGHHHHDHAAGGAGVDRR